MAVAKRRKPWKEYFKPLFKGKKSFREVKPPLKQYFRIPKELKTKKENNMTVAKIAPYNFGRLKKKVKKVARRFFAPPSRVPGQMDYPTIPKAIKAQKKRRELLNKMGR